ncbi:MAG: tetratricopeptide repeat protein, partial [Anaerolineales bacterium]|nr:tetratricopeptide repeat protein [Anaerolineales bacterium]
MKRADLLQLIDAALAVQQASYAAQVARRYLADWPDDLGLQFQLARAYLSAGETAAARPVLEQLTAADPEHSAAQRRLAECQLAADPPAAAALAAAAFAAAHIGDGRGAPAALPLPAWAVSTRVAVLAERAGDLETARRESLAGLAADAGPLPSLVHLTTLWHVGQFELALPLAEAFVERWPNTVAFKLCLAEALFAAGDVARATAVLHDAAALDVSGEVAARHWGEAHPYRALWQAELAAPLPGPLPAELIQALGLNRLPGRVAPAGAEAGVVKSAPLVSPEASAEIAAIQSQLNAVAQRLPRRAAPHSAPSPADAECYVLLSSRTRLAEKFGGEGFAQVDAAIRTLAQAPAGLRGLVVYVDEAATLQPFGLQPVDARQAWDIKLLLRGLVEALRARGETLAAVLIVGGPEIVPFHHLPNPTEDPDADIPSDNPYATADENYFAPDWPVGRLPTSAGRDPAPLVRALQAAARHHSSKRGAAQRGWLTRLWSQLTQLWRPAAAAAPANPAAASFGYSANVWKQASVAVFGAIGHPRDLRTCPPLDAAHLPSEGLAPARFSY